MYTFVDIKKFPSESATLVNWVNQSFQIIRTRTFVSIGTATSILRASQIFFFSFFLFFFFPFFSRNQQFQLVQFLRWWFRYVGRGSGRFSTRIFTTRPRNPR